MAKFLLISEEYMFCILNINMWVWESISSCIDMDEVRKNPNLPWDRASLSDNPGLRISDVLHLNTESMTDDWDPEMDLPTPTYCCLVCITYILLISEEI